MLKIKLIVFFVVVFCSTFFAQLLDQRNWRKTEKDSLAQALRLIEEQKAELAFGIIQTIYYHHSNEEFLKYTYAKCAIYIDEKQEDALKKLQEIYDKNANTTDIHFYLALASYQLWQFDEALNYINVYLGTVKVSFDIKPVAELFKKQINFARNFYSHPTDAKVVAMSENFNDKGNQIFPVINLEASQLFYTEGLLQNTKLINQSSNTQLGHIYRSKSIDENFKLPEAFKQLLDKDNARIAALSVDGQKMLLIKDNCGQSDIFISTLNGDKFSKPKRLKGAVNSMYNENACCFSPDGKKLFFSSNRSGGFGGYDLYCATLNDDSTWTNVVNLGTKINSSMDEDGPFMHANGETLFFSSKGFDSMGGFDIFKTTINLTDLDCSGAENLGYPINSIADDLGFVMSANGEEAFLCSNRKGSKGQMDLYSLQPNFKNFAPKFCILKGKVNLNDEAAQANLSIENIENGKIVNSTFSNSQSGQFLFVLPIGRRLQLNVWIRNFQSKTIDLDLSDVQGFIETIKNIEFSSLTDSLMMNDLTQNVINKKSQTVSQTKSKNKISKQKSLKVKTENSLATEMPSESMAAVNTHDNVANTNEKDNLFHFQTFGTNGSSIGMFDRQNSNEEESTYSGKKAATKYKEEEKISIVSSTIKSEKVSGLKNKKPIQIIETIDNVVDSAELADRKEFMAWLAEGETKKTESKFVPANEVQQRIVDCNAKNGEVKKEGLVFKIQIAANKEAVNKKFPKLKHLGKIEQMDFQDDFIRYTIGGSFETYAAAFEFGKKVIEAGHSGIYIFGVMADKRYKVEDLIEEGIFK